MKDSEWVRRTDRLGLVREVDLELRATMSLGSCWKWRICSLAELLSLEVRGKDLFEGREGRPPSISPASSAGVGESSSILLDALRSMARVLVFATTSALGVMGEKSSWIWGEGLWWVMALLADKSGGCSVGLMGEKTKSMNW